MKREISPVYIGDVVRHKVITPKGEVDEIMGSAYCCAVAASTIAEPRTFGIVAGVGRDLKLDPLGQRMINLAGVAAVREKSRVLTLIEREDGSRDFSEPEYGKAGVEDTSIYPRSVRWSKLCSSCNL